MIWKTILVAVSLLSEITETAILVGEYMQAASQDPSFTVPQMQQPKASSRGVKPWVVIALVVAVSVLVLALYFAIQTGVQNQETQNEEAQVLTEAPLPDMGVTITPAVTTNALLAYTAELEDPLAMQASFVSFTPPSTLTVATANGQERRLTMSPSTTIFVIDQYTLDETGAVVGVSYGDPVGAETLSNLQVGNSLRLTLPSTASASLTSIRIYPTE